jgi:DNA-binding HxlR family transcriptional regulator
VSRDEPACDDHYHRAVELVGRRWSGAIIAVLLEHGPLRFKELADAVPAMSDRMLTARVAELEDAGVLERRRAAGRAEYALTEMGRDLRPAVAALQDWGRRWMTH